MAKANQLAVEVHFVPLSLPEMEERRERLRVLLLRGALRVVQHQPEDNLSASDSISPELVQE
jgi:hypothetical protein